MSKALTAIVCLLASIAWIVFFYWLIVLIVDFIDDRAMARDLGQWQNGDPAIREWYQGLMQPDAPTVSCCGPADSYWCDDVHVRDSKVYCKITDDRDDGPLGRPHRDIGEEFEIPPNKLKYDAGNPTGHAVIFLSTGGWVYCYVQGAGI